MKKNKVILFMLILFSLWTACLKKEDFDFDKLKEVKYDPLFALPLLDVKITPDKILKRLDSLHRIYTDQDGILSFITELTSSSIVGSDLFSISEQTLNSAITFNNSTVTAYNAAPAGSTFHDSFELDWFWNLTDLELDSVIFKGGRLNFTGNSNFSNPVTVSYRFPSWTNSSGILNQSNPVNAFSNFNNNLSIAGSKLVLTDGVNTNRFKVSIKISITKLAGSTINSGNYVSFDIGLREPAFSRIHGYFGQTNLSIDEARLNLGLFKSFEDGSVHFENPILRLHFDNYYGIQINVHTISPFVALDKNSNTYPITGLTPPYLFGSPAKPGESNRSTIELNGGNSNLKNLLTIPIQHIDFGANAIINPAGPVMRNFATDSSTVDMTVEVEIPFHGSASNFSIRSINPFTNIPNEFDEMEYLEIKLIVENMFAIDMGFQLYFMDANEVIIDSLFQDFSDINIVKSATVNANGFSNQPGMKISFIKLNREQLKKLADNKVEKAEIYARASTHQNGNVIIKVSPNDYFHFKAGIKAQIDTKLK